MLYLEADLLFGARLTRKEEAAPCQTQTRLAHWHIGLRTELDKIQQESCSDTVRTELRWSAARYNQSGKQACRSDTAIYGRW